MFLTNKNVQIPKYLDICGSNVEVVTDFKLLGVQIDKDLTFTKHINSLKKSVNTKLYSISKLFYLSYQIKTQFFKTYIQPHFDYCSSLSVYWSASLTLQLDKLFNNCISKLLNLNLLNKTIEEQYLMLRPLNILPYKLRLFSNLCFFSHKVLNKKILPDFKNSLQKSSITYNLRDIPIYTVPKTRTKSGAKCFSVFLPNFVNQTIRYAYELSFSEFKSLILSYIVLYFKRFPSNYKIFV